MQIGTTQLRRLSRAATIATAIVVTVTMVGCYWTPPDDEGAISISLNIEDVESSSLGASATGTVDAFFFAQIASESLLQEEPDAAEAAIAEANQKLEAQFEELETDPTSTDLDSFEVAVSEPDVQLQAAFLNLGDATGSSSSFSGLRAGESYLVTVFGSRFDSETESSPDFNVGFTTATITGGETKEVNLTLGSTYEQYNQFLVDEYGISMDDSGTTDDTSDTGGNISATIYPGGYYASNPNDYNVPETLHYDFIDASQTPIDISPHVSDGASNYAEDYSTTVSQYLSTVIQEATVVDSSGTVVSGTSRPIADTISLETALSLSLSNIEPGQTLQLLITSEAERGTEPIDLSPQTAIGISSSFTVEAGVTSVPIVYLYVWDNLIN